jgi:hypothetical protein
MIGAVRGMRPLTNSQWLITADEGTKLGRRWVSRYIQAIPILWLMGILLPAAIALLVLLGRRRWVKGRWINCIVLAWIGIGLVQALCALLQSRFLEDLPHGVHYVLWNGVYGWIAGGLGIALGYSYGLACREVVRAITVLGAVIILLTMVSYTVRLAGVRVLIVPTPVSMIAPESDTVRFYATANFFFEEDNAGTKDTRLTLFSPWPTSFGLGGAVITLLSSLERSRLWRSVGIVGGLLATISCLSRIASAALLAAVAVNAFMRVSTIVKSLIVSMVLLGLLAVLLSGSDPISLVKFARGSVNDMRGGSSMVRDMIYWENWNGFWKSPIIGNGWPGESVAGLSSIGTPLMPIGTHSSLSGLLYTGGVLTFGTFMMASMLTFVAAVRATLQTSFGSEARRFTLVGLGLLIVLYLFAPYESIFADTLPVIYLFTWIGGVFRIGRDYAST